jgi:hypothetical protein
MENNIMENIKNECYECGSADTYKENRSLNCRGCSSLFLDEL